MDTFRYFFFNMLLTPKNANTDLPPLVFLAYCCLLPTPLPLFCNKFLIGSKYVRAISVFNILLA